MNKIIFLDVDGVLNTVLSTFANLSQEIWDKNICNLLINICKNNPDVKIVVSSTWRYAGKEDTLQHFNNNGFKSDYFHEDWRTPISMQTNARGYEIGLWLTKHPEITAYAILDDDSDILPHQNMNFVKTHAYNGITYNQYLDLCKILDVEDNYLR